MAEPIGLPIPVSSILSTLLGIVPLLAISIILLTPILRSRFLPPATGLPLPELPSTRTQSDNAHQPRPSHQKKSSKSSINIKPLILSAQGIVGDKHKLVSREDFGMPPRPSQEHEGRMKALFGGSKGPVEKAQVEEKVVTGRKEEGKVVEGWLEPYVGLLVAAGVTVISGMLYLALATPTAPAAVNLLLGLSITILPVTLAMSSLPYILDAIFTYTSTFLIVTASCLTSIGLGALGAWVSPYIPLAVSGILLLASTIVLEVKIQMIKKAYQYLSGRGSIRLEENDRKRKTKIFFSGPLSGSTARRPNDQDFEEVIRGNSWKKGSSWLDSTGEQDTCEQFSSFSYETSDHSHRLPLPTKATRISGPHFPYTIDDASPNNISVPQTPQTAHTCLSRSSSQRSYQDLEGRRTSNGYQSGSGRATPNQTFRCGAESWMTEPTITPTTISSFSFGSTDEPVPVIPSPYRIKSSENLPEGPSILKSTNPFDNTFGSRAGQAKVSTASSNFAAVLPKKVSSGQLSRMSSKSYRSPLEGDEVEETFPQDVMMELEEELESVRSRGGKKMSSTHSMVDVRQSKKGSVPIGLGYPSSSSADVGSDRPRASPETVNSQFGFTYLPSRPPSSLEGLRQPGSSTQAQYVTMPLRSNEQLNLSANPFGRISPFGALSPATAQYFGSEKTSTDALLVAPAQGSSDAQSQHVAWQGRRTSFEQTMQAADQTNEVSMMQEQDDQSKRLYIAGAILTSAFWLSWGLALPILIMPDDANILVIQTLFLIATIMPSLALTCGLLLLRRIPADTSQISTTLTARRSVQRQASIQSAASRRFQQGLDRIADMSSKSIITDVDPIASPKWSTWLKPKASLSNLRKSAGQPDPRGPEKIQADNTAPSDRASQNRYNVQMHRLSGNVWLENGHAPKTSGGIDRLVGMAGPYPRLSAISPPRNNASNPHDDPDATPRPQRTAANANTGRFDPVKMSPISFRVGTAYQPLPSRGPTPAPAIEVDTPSKFDVIPSRAQSVVSSPGEKSLSRAEVKTAVRGRMSGSMPYFFTDSEGGVADFSMRASMEDAGMNYEAQAGPSRIMPGSTPTSMAAPPDFGLDWGSSPARKRRSNMSMEEQEKPVQEKRRTLDFAKDMLNKVRGRDDSQISQREQEAIELEAMNNKVLSNLVAALGIEETEPEPAPAPGAPRLSHSTVRTTDHSMDLTTFRPSLDFVPPPLPTRGRAASLDIASASFDFARSSDGHQSTPVAKQANLDMTASLASRRSLPLLSPKTTLLEDVKGALRQYGRNIDTPAKTPPPVKVSRKKSSRQNPLPLPKRSMSPLRGILKTRPSLDALAIGIDLPPIPREMKKAAEREKAAIGKASGRITPLEEMSAHLPRLSGSTSPTQLTQPRKKTSQKKLSAHPTDLAPVYEKDEGSIRSSAMSTRTVADANSVAVAGKENMANFSFPENVKSPSDDGHMPSAPFAAEGMELSFDHDGEQLAEMEMVMTEMDSPTTSEYLSNPSRSRPTSLASAPAAIENFSFNLPLPNDPRALNNKVSTDTFATIRTFDSTSTADVMNGSPSPAVRPFPSRSSLILPSSAHEARAVSSSNIASASKIPIPTRTSIHGANDASTFGDKPVIPATSMGLNQSSQNRLIQGGSITLSGGIRPLILPTVHKAEKERRASVILQDKRNSGLLAPAPVAEKHERGDSACKFDDAEEEVFKRLSPMKGRQNGKQPVGKAAMGGKSSPKKTNVFVDCGARAGSVSPTKMRPGSRASTRGGGPVGGRVARV